VVSIFLIVFVNSVTNISSSLLFLIIVCYMSWIYSIIDILTVREVWSDKLLDFSKIR